MWLAAGVGWTGLEYFRSEVYFLKFSWLSVGYAFSGGAGQIPIGLLGVYGIGFVIFLAAGAVCQLPNARQGIAVFAVTGLMAAAAHAPTHGKRMTAGTSVVVAGVQLEFPPDLEVPKHLNRLLCTHPDAEILVLSEYTFDGAIPKRVRDWCRKNGRYLIAGGKDDSPGTNYFNTVFVVDPRGEIVFQQGKSAPIQFFKDGLPAKAQEVWESPWGKIAIPVCYDLSYRRIMDRFVAKGAQGIIVPFMDVVDWGARQHELHARVAPLRAREYGIPIFRVGSSGISQEIDAQGEVRGSLPCPGEGNMLAGRMEFAAPGRVPFDRWLGPSCSWLTGGFVLAMLGERLTQLRA